ncbi:phosphate ABC transporter substrate-binding protein PstS family protein [Apilactobacillus xinyiensis]|jgi:phosphate transport system substrate-binding protein|uniref:phosphate ABC transporter substrate-binding protein PstS family protein n=1 Tax=Apilactobacillus xinyiensis TaxID=2841032 RepID=UPI001C7D8B50|nr:phosphate ABC transporter substrate-binding protein PstS family protein [Apilactobacillus xinyiensis]MCL0311897.1 phosphate ABC transporter substrate-binding protein PstS family protein [Apilactobacillus xinyiensis]MCL0319163.1 phosphate ABC transporter substrate-binding protein PstS family protein [Apilactobacillus xinyiensis]MCL0329705.1 phosphate ABC transporter substrate-binding protein PstS family protein [Apilactobacillus xinyiensis]
MNNRLIHFISALGILILFLTGCSSNNGSKSKEITSVGSTALQPLVEQAAHQYSTEKGLTINVQGGGSGTGLSQVSQGAVNIGNSDVFADKQTGIDAKKLTDYKVAVVGITPVVNKGVGVKNISFKQLRDIFTGKVTNWKQLGGKNQEIIVINRVKGSGTRNTFESSVLNGEKALNAQEQDSNGTVKRIVSSTPGAISYLSFSFLDNTLQPLSIDGVKPEDKNVEDNSWKIWSYEHMYTAKDAKKNVKDFIQYLQSKPTQDGLVKKLGYISIHDMKVVKSSDNVVTKK